MILAQLSTVTSQLQYDFGAQILVDQALWLALEDKITWSRKSDNELHGEVLIALPGQKPVSTPVVFFKSYTDAGVGYYLSLGDKRGPCRNSFDKRVAVLAERLLGKVGASATCACDYYALNAKQAMVC